MRLHPPPSLACVRRRSETFVSQELTYGTTPEQMVLALAIDDALQRWEADLAENFPETLSVVKAARTTLRNLRAPTDQPGTTGKVHFSQVLAYSWDQGHEIRLSKLQPLPVFPDGAAWTALADDMLQGLAMLAMLAGFPIQMVQPVNLNQFSKLVNVPRKDANMALLKAEIPQLDLHDGFQPLHGETVFCHDDNLMPAA